MRQAVILIAKIVAKLAMGMSVSDSELTQLDNAIADLENNTQN